MKKYIVGAILSIGILVSPTFTHAAGLTSAQISAIIGLLQAFGADQSIINNVQISLTGGTPTGGGTQAWCHTFNTNLKVGDEGNEVATLQEALSKQGFTFGANFGRIENVAGVAGHRYGFYRDETASAVTGFQEKYASDILAPNGLSHGTGYVGPITRAKLNALYGCHASQSTSQTQTSITFPPDGWYVHNFDTSIMLTKQKALPSCQGTEGACYGEQIDIHISTTTLTPEQHIAKIIQDGVYPSTQKWGTLNGHKSFSMTYTTDANTVPTDGQYIFIGSKVYQILLYPSDEKNRNDFQQVVNYYATKSQ